MIFQIQLQETKQKTKSIFLAVFKLEKELWALKEWKSTE